MKNTIHQIKNLNLVVAFILLFTSTLLFSQDNRMSIDPTFMLFPVQNVGEETTPITISIKNNNYTEGMHLQYTNIEGPNRDEFNITADHCSHMILADGETCSLQITFKPNSLGTKSALLTIPYVDQEDNMQTLSTYLTNKEDTKHMVKRRLQPIMSDLMMPHQLTEGNQHIIYWSVLGYHNSYKTMMVLFDCTDIPEGECGANFSDPNKLQSPILSPIFRRDSDWSYGTETAMIFEYDYNLEVGPKRPNGEDWNATGTPVVVRFYISSEEDIIAEKPSQSLIIPGNLPVHYYDTSGRKIDTVIYPAE